MIDKIFKLLEKVERNEAITIKEISETLGEEEKKIAGILQRLRKSGIVGFEKRAVDMIAQINYALSDKTAERSHHMNTYFYWGQLQ